MSEINRRDFMKVVGVTGAASAVACDPMVPIENVLPYVVQPSQIVPGVATWLSTQCNECSANCGVLARNREGRVVKLEGNPDHPTNKGSLCSVGQAGIQATYSADRHTGPLKGGNPVDWISAIAEIKGALNKGRVAWIGYPRTGATGGLIQSFMSDLGYDRPLYWDPVGNDALRAASKAIFGMEGTVPSYDLSRAHVILSFGSDFLATGGDVAQQRAWADSRDPAKGGFVSRTICVEPRVGISSAVTDLHLNARPGSETSLALAMARALCEYEKDDVKGPDFPPQLASALQGIDIDQAVLEADILRGSFDLVVKYLAEAFSAEHPTVVLPGGHATSSNATELAKATLLLNHILGNIGGAEKTVSFNRPDKGLGNKNEAGSGSYGDLAELLEKCKNKDYDVLFIDGIDLAHVLPTGIEVLSALQGVGTVVAFANESNETVNPTALGSGFVLPPGTTLENWGDGEGYRGVHTLQQPAMKPLLDTRSIGDVILDLAELNGQDLGAKAPWLVALKQKAADCVKRNQDIAAFAALKKSIADLGIPAEGAEPVAPEVLESKQSELAALLEADPSLENAVEEACGSDTEDAPVDSWAEYLKRYWRDVVYSKSGKTEDFDAFWIRSLQLGGYFEQPAAVDISFTMESLPDAGQVAPSGNVLVLFPHPFLMDGRHANKPWAQEVPEPVSSHTWGSWVEVHPETAAAKGLEEGKTVQLSANSQNIEVAWFGSPGIRKDTFALVMGNGHKEGRYAKVGGPDNPIQMIGSDSDNGGALSYVATAGVEISAVGNDTTVNAYIGNIDQDGRPINFTVSTEDLGKGDGPGSIVPMHHFPVDPRLVKAGIHDMYPEPEHPTHRFALAIDLNRCTGCNACSTACFAENNIPVVGPDQMARSRYMGWIRLSRYWEGEGDTPDIRYQPVMCQQCSHAPCEGVCPVLATYHNLDGLNAMIYNRCVGTRYCANNCAYTARRFNFHSYQWPDSYNLMLNPDIVVREMGVMEKCTFCVHRLREAKDARRDEVMATDQLGGLDELNRPKTVVPEDRLKKLTACAQACPTDAITFGNFKTQKKGEQHKDDVYWKFQDERAYTMLGELNTKPGVRYLARITHGATQLHHGGGHDDGHADDGDGHGESTGH